MSGRRWNVGDVATWPGMGTVICVGYDPDHPGYQTKWAHQWGGFSWYDGADIRRLLVLDPDAVAPGLTGRILPSLLDACAEIVEDHNHPREVRETAMLRRLADLFEDATKPLEPMGDGAVVEDRQGHRWVRIAGREPERESKPWRHRGHTARTWDHINAVRVLSEGVPS